MTLVLPKKEKQSGQVVLITLLILAVVLSVGMSIISRSITDVKTSQQSQESARAFWVAQGELEKAIRANSTSSSIGQVDISYEVSRSTLGDSAEFLYPEQVKADVPITVWFVGHTADGDLDLTQSVHPSTLNLYWGGSANNKSALEAVFVYQDAGVYKQKRYTYDPNITETASGFESITAGSYTVLNNAFTYRAQIDNIDDLPTVYFVRIRLFGDSTLSPLAIESDVSLPSQGSCFSSTAVVESSGVTRKLSECRLYGGYPSIFDSAIFSGISI